MSNTNTIVPETIRITAVLPDDYSVSVELPKKQNNVYSLEEDVLPYIVDIQLPPDIIRAVVRNDPAGSLVNLTLVPLLDKDVLYLMSEPSLVKKSNIEVCLKLKQNEQLGPDNGTEDDINAEGIKFVRKQSWEGDIIFNALGHQIYYLPQFFCKQHVFPYADRNELPRLRILPTPPLLVAPGHPELFIDYYEDGYFEYIAAAVKLYHTKVAKIFQFEHNESHWQNSLYRLLLSTVSVNADVGGLEALQIHENILLQSKFSSNARSKLAAGLKPGITDGWLMRYKPDELLTPDGIILSGNILKFAEEYDFKMGDDMYLLIDFLMELKKKDTSDVDKYKVMLEAAACLACFRGLMARPAVFLGTGNCTHVRLYFARYANNAEKKEVVKRVRSKSESREFNEVIANRRALKDRRRSKSTGSKDNNIKSTGTNSNESKSVSKDNNNKSPGSKGNNIKSTGTNSDDNKSKSEDIINIHTIVKEMFSERLTSLDAFLVFAVILWRLCSYRKRQFQEWLANAIEVAARTESTVTVKSTIVPAVEKVIPSRSPVKQRKNATGNITLAGTSNVKTILSECELMAAWDFDEVDVIDEDNRFKIIKGKVHNFGLAVLKIDWRLGSIANEIKIYEHLTQAGFEGMPKLLNSVTTSSFGAVLLEYIDNDQIFDVETMDDLIDYSYRLLKGIEYLHSFGVVHGDIKPSNLFTTKKYSVTPAIFIDFAFAHVMGDERAAKMLGYTAGYTSPEVIKSKTVTLADDIYSAGVVIMSMASQMHHRGDDYTLHHAWQDFNADRAPLGNKQVQELVHYMTCPRDQRWTATQLLQSQLFKNWLPFLQ